MPRCPTCMAENRAAARFCDTCGAPLTASTLVDRRKVATLLFCDVTGSTALAERVDAESVREIMFEYFDAMRGAIDAHGGTVEKFVGDAVVAVFGVPTAHEDDALRAVRAAGEMRERLGTLNDGLGRRFGTTINVRIGVNTGEVVAGDTTPHASLVTGDAVNVAARLQQMAAPGEVLLGELTYALVHDAVDAEPVAPVALKGKVAPVGTYRLLGVHDHGAARRPSGSPMVGRDAELATLRAAFDDVCAGGSAAGVLVVGEPGVGKSRLADAFLGEIVGGVRVLAARCLPYGEGITYLPLAQLLRQAAGIPDLQEPGDARERLARAVSGDPEAAVVLPPLQHVLGLAEGVSSPAQIAWATRKILEAVAREQPVVVLVDDLQWAEPPLRELLEHIAQRGRQPILVLSLARPELEPPSLGLTADVRLGPLSDHDAADLAARLLTTRVADVSDRARLLAVAGGNPLFLEELVTFVEAGGSLWSDMPPSLDALLSARLDALPQAERTLLERASVEGEVFHRGAILALYDAEERPAARLTLGRLQESGLVRTTRAGRAGETAFRFRHLLVRDAAYRSTPKSRRAALHLRHALWLEARLGERLVEGAEIVGYHLERAWRLRDELGPLDDDTVAIGSHAAELLSSAGRRSLARGDTRAALKLFTSATELAADSRDRAEHSLQRGRAAREAGEFALAEEVVASVRAEAAEAGWRALEAHADVELAMLLLHTQPYETSARLREAGERSLLTFGELDDDHGLAVALVLLARERWLALRCAEMETLLERALPHAERSGDDRLVASVLIGLAQAVLFGPRPATEAAARCEQLLDRARTIGPTAAANISMMLAVLEASLGRDEHAQRLSATSKAVMEELAPGPPVAGAGQYAGLAALVSGAPARAEQELRQATELLEALGERAIASTVVALRARALVELGRTDEAERCALLGLEWADAGDIASQSYARGALARVLLTRGDVTEARRNALEAVDLSAECDFLNQRGDAYLDLALVLQACGDPDGARAAADKSCSYFRAKGNVVSAERAFAAVRD